MYGVKLNKVAAKIVVAFLFCPNFIFYSEKC
ncbi:hypothetical protein LISA103140_05520 [Ligilactobacillus salivarius]